MADDYMTPNTYSNHGRIPHFVWGEDDRFEGWIDRPGWPTREEMKRKTPEEVEEVLRNLEAEVAEYDRRRAEIAETEALIEECKRKIAERDGGENHA